MNETLVIDASVAIKWIVQEKDTNAALGLRSRFRFTAPDLIVAECSNILWKKAQRAELTRDEATMASRLLKHADIELQSSRGLIEEMTALAIDLAYPAYDCSYLTLARQKQFRFVTADKRLLEVVDRKAPAFKEFCLSLDEANNMS
jgi:predicted nucleic acid-binding protein